MKSKQGTVKKKKIVIAGANGFLGSRLVAEALLHGMHVVALARSTETESAEYRVLRELTQYLTPEQREKVKDSLTVYNYDITIADIGLSPEVVSELNDTVDAVFNCIGDTNFFPKDIDHLFATNIDGPLRMLKTLCRKKAVFNHLSTAYICGARSGIIHEADLDKGQAFKNHYEKSKFSGEKEVHKVCLKNGIPYNIFRPSIVIRNGSGYEKIPYQNHFYSFVGLLNIIKNTHTRDNGDDDKKLHISVRFHAVKDYALNFVDLNYVVRAMYYIGVNAPQANKTYHLVNPAPMTNQEFLVTIMEVYNIEGFQIIEDKDDFTKLNAFEKLIKRGLSQYLDYFFVDAKFDETNTQKALSGSGVACPDFDIEYISRSSGIKSHEYEHYLMV